MTTRIFIMSATASFMMLMPVHAAALNDGQILKFMKSVDDCEIDMAKVAERKSQVASVKAFAEKMSSEHKDNESKIKTVSKEQKIKPSDSDERKSLTSRADSKQKDLKKLNPSDFDKAYISAQVEMHEELLKSLDSSFISTAENPALKTYLQETKDHVQAHLDEAKQIQSSL